jgi:hypothetical protein
MAPLVAPSPGIAVGTGLDRPFLMSRHLQARSRRHRGLTFFLFFLSLFLF